MDRPTNIVVLLFVILLLIAAWSDIATRVIPNGLLIAIAIHGAVMRLMAGMEALAVSLGLALGIFPRPSLMDAGPQPSPRNRVRDPTYVF
jgi:Flp pilus assembly protein protease CpaA